MRGALPDQRQRIKIGSNREELLEELLKYVRAQLLIQLQTAQVALAQAGGLPIKVEVLLSDAGFSHKEIATLLGRTQGAVAKAVSRARASAQKGGAATDANSGGDDV